MNLLEMDGQLLAVLTVGALIFFVVVWVGLGVSRAREDMSNRLALYGRTTGGVIRDDELAKPLAQRTIGPIVLKMSNFLRRFTPVGYMEKIQHKLILAGNPGNLDASSFVVIKFLTTALGLFAAFFLVDYGSDGLQRTVLFILPIVLGFFGPNAWLQRKIDDRAPSDAAGAARCPRPPGDLGGSRARFRLCSLQGGGHGPRPALRGVLPDAPGDPGRREPP